MIFARASASLAVVFVNLSFNWTDRCRIICEKLGSFEGHDVWWKGPRAGIKFSDAAAAKCLRPLLDAATRDQATAAVYFGVNEGTHSRFFRLDKTQWRQ